MTVRDSEAAELRNVAEGVIRGRSLSSLVRDLNERGVLTATGKTWTTTSLQAALLSPRDGGERRHRGRVIGKGAWPAILDAHTAVAERSTLTDPAWSVTPPPSLRRHDVRQMPQAALRHVQQEKGNSVPTRPSGTLRPYTGTSPGHAGAVPHRSVGREPVRVASGGQVGARQCPC